MTTGNKTLDSTTGSATYTGTGYPPYTASQVLSGYGPYASKVWSGGDTLSSQLKTKVPSGPIGMKSIVSRGPRQYTYTDKKGKAHYKREKIVREVPIWPPRRPRTKRKLPPHDYSVVIRDDTICPVYREDWDNFRRIAPVAPCSATLAGVSNDEHYKLIEKLRRKAFGSGWHPGIFLAEMPQALHMLANAATRIRLGAEAAINKSWRGVVRNLLGGTNPGKGSRAYRAFVSYRQGKIGLSAFWLELQYGWYPLIGDMEDAAAYIGWAVGSGDYLPTRLKARRDVTLTALKDPSTYEISFSEVTSKIRLQYVIMEMKAKPMNIPTIASAASVAWEKLPWSFVADWAIPISAYLQALRTASDIQGTVVFTVYRTDTHKNVKKGAGVKRFWFANSMQPRYERTTVTRTVRSEITPPSPIPDLSPGNVVHSWTRATNALALLAQYSLGKAYRWHTPIG